MNQIICNTCKKEFNSYKKNRKHCSQECRIEGMRTGFNVFCDNCGVETYVKKSTYEKRKNQLFFCNHSCCSTYYNNKRGTKYDWKLVGEYYNQNHTIDQCMEKFGFYRQSFFDAINRGDLVIKKRLKRKALKDLLIDNCEFSQTHFRERFKKSGIVDYLCVECGCGDMWNGKPITLHVDHINGKNNDNRLENLRILCPNCHSQTPTYCLGERKML